MSQEEILSYINDSLVINGSFYSNQNLPNQISNAIYTFGDYNVFEILAFIDATKEQDGSRGMIITPAQIYFKFGQAGIIEYQKIISLGLEKHRNDSIIKAIIKLEEITYTFSNQVIDPEVFVTMLSKITGIEIEMIMDTHKKVEYYTRIVLNDLENDEYEDILLTPTQNNSIKEFYKELEMVQQLADEDYQYELENICNRALEFFDVLGLDSDEIDGLLECQNQFNQKNIEEEQKIDNAQQFYNDMMNKYQQGDSEMFNRVKSIMSSMGIDENDLAGKSPEEIEDFLCGKFGISKSMLEKLAGKFNKSTVKH